MTWFPIRTCQASIRNADAPRTWEKKKQTIFYWLGKWVKCLICPVKTWVTGRKMARPEQQEWTWKFSTWTLGTLSQITGTTGEKQNPYRIIYCICKLFFPLKHFFKKQILLGFEDAAQPLYLLLGKSAEFERNHLTPPHMTEDHQRCSSHHVPGWAGTVLNTAPGNVQIAGNKCIFKKKNYQEKRACEFCSLSYLSHVPERAKDRQPSVSYVPAVAVWHQRCFRGTFGQLLPFHNIWLGRRLLFFLRTVPAFWLFFQI